MSMEGIRWRVRESMRMSSSFKIFIFLIVDRRWLFQTLTTRPDGYTLQLKQLASIPNLEIPIGELEV